MTTVPCSHRKKIRSNEWMEVKKALFMISEKTAKQANQPAKRKSSPEPQAPETKKTRQDSNSVFKASLPNREAMTPKSLSNVHAAKPVTSTQNKPQKDAPKLVPGLQSTTANTAGKSGKKAKKKNRGGARLQQFKQTGQFGTLLSKGKKLFLLYQFLCGQVCRDLRSSLLLSLVVKPLGII